LYDLIT